MASHQNRKMAQPPEGKAHFAYQALVILPVLIYDRMFRTFVCWSGMHPMTNVLRYNILSFLRRLKTHGVQFDDWFLGKKKKKKNHISPTKGALVYQRHDSQHCHVLIEGMMYHKSLTRLGVSSIIFPFSTLFRQLFSIFCLLPHCYVPIHFVIHHSLLPSLPLLLPLCSPSCSCCDCFDQRK